jgi:hypothetical protein
MQAADDVVRPSRGVAAKLIRGDEAEPQEKTAAVQDAAPVRAARISQSSIRKDSGAAERKAGASIVERQSGARAGGGSPEARAGAVISRAAAASSVHGEVTEPARANRSAAPGGSSAAVRSGPEGEAAARSATRGSEAGRKADAEARGDISVKVRGAAKPTTRNSNSGLRPSVAEVGGRAVIGRTGIMTGSNIDEEIDKRQPRRARTAAASESVAAAENIFAGKKEEISAAAEISECSAAYFDCMNQFCNVLDANQKQCTCSNRLSSYKATEDSLSNANNELNDVAQQIRYVGLSADEVRSILKETEAEQVMSSLSDTTQSRKMLEQIESMIRNPESGSSSSSGGSSGLDFELDFGGSSDFSDMGNLFSNNASFANMRGTELYSAAKSKCKSIMTRCAPKSADQGIISGQYEIEIDKACVAYEAGMKKAIQNVKTNVRSAIQMLQKARLAVLESHNEYDARGCVGALDSCMKDDMVCGEKYYKCIDPDKKTVDESGKVIPGSDITGVGESMKDYSAASLDTLAGQTSCTTSNDHADLKNGCKIIKYLRNKIGESSGGTLVSGFCRPVLDRCRQFTYQDGVYVPNNSIVKSYLERAMTQIYAAKNSIMTEYASTCIADVSACYNSQITQVQSYATGISLTPDLVKPVLMGACRNVALSCAYALFPTTTDCNHSVTENNPVTENNQNACIDKLSKMFYQALMCPVNSTWDTGCTSVASINDKNACVSHSCKCKTNYYVVNGQCLSTPSCPANSIWITDSNTSTGSVDDQGKPTPHCQCNKVGAVIFDGSCPV